MKMNQYSSYVAQYITMEFIKDEDFEKLTVDEKYVIKQMLTFHYQKNNSINNAASDVVSYIRENREWMRENK